MRTQVNVFHEHKEEDSEEFSHRYDNVRIEFEYPLLFLPVFDEHENEFYKIMFLDTVYIFFILMVML